MAVRTRSAAILIFVGLAPLVLGGPVFAVFMAALGIACWREYLTFASVHASTPRWARGVGATAIGAFALAGLLGWTTPIVVGIAVLACVVLLVGQFGRAGDPTALASWGFGAAGMLYLGLPVLAATGLRQMPGSAAPWLTAMVDRASIGWSPAAFGCAWALAAALCTWSGDTGAYLIGRAAGRRKLSPTISPNKTVEGALGGLVGSTLAGAACWLAFGLPGGWPLGAGVGVVLGAGGQFGDLAESFMKRAAGVKDSGSSLPGHGGVFDRVDALLATFPLAWLLAELLDAARR